MASAIPFVKRSKQVLSVDQNELIIEYQTRLRTAEEKHDKKFQEIRDSRKSIKQYYPTGSEDTLASNTAVGGNMLTENVTRSKYWHPIVTAINKKIKTDLTAQPVRFEFAPNEKIGIETAEVFMNVIRDNFTRVNNMTEYALGLEYLTGSGTMITQPMALDMDETVLVEKVDEDGNKYLEKQALIEGKALAFRTYDPLQTVVDWRATPGKVADTAEWCIVTIGIKSPQWIEENYDVKVQIKDESKTAYGQGQTNQSYVIIDSYKREVEEDAGLDYNTGIVIREYYLNDGRVYTIADDGYILDESWNSSRIVNRIPIDFTPFEIDPDSPYGISPAEMLKPTVEVLSTAVNSVCDMNSMKIKSPWVTIKGLLEDSGYTSTPSGLNDILHLDISALSISDGPKDYDVRKLFAKPDFDDVTEGGMFMFNVALDNVWYISGLSPASLAGVQDKQVRVADFTQMISNASLRNSSSVVRNLETYFMNPTAHAFQRMYYTYYKDFPQLRKEKISKEDVKNFSSIRVVNGSFLAEDQRDRLNKAMFAYQLSQTNASLDANKATSDVLDAVGIIPERLFRPPLEMLQENQLMALLSLMQQLGPEQFQQAIIGTIQSKQGGEYSNEQEQ